MSATPRTDAEQFTIWQGPAFDGTQHEVVSLAFARELERENTRLRTVLAVSLEDSERIDWLEGQGAKGLGWIARDSTTGRGYRLHQDISAGTRNVREAIDAVRAPAQDPAQLDLPA